MFLSLIRIAVVVLLSFPVASACVCASTPSVAESFSKATVVFTGTVIARGKYGSWFRVAIMERCPFANDLFVHWQCAK